MYRIFKIKKIKTFFLLLMLALLLFGLFGSVHIHSAAVAETVSPQNEIYLPIIMYHSVLEEDEYQGKYVISPEVLESDLKYLKSKGYSPVFMSDVVSYVYNGKPLAENPIILSFDDGYYNNYYYALPLAQKYEMKMIIAPIGYYTDIYSEQDADHPNYSHITWTEAEEMLDSGYFEFQNHTYNLHSLESARKGADKVKGETYESYKTAVGGDINKMQEKLKNNLGVQPNTMVFPFGAYCKDSITLAKELGFKATFTCSEKMNVISQNDPESLFELGRFLRPAGIDSEDFFENHVKLE